MSLPIIAAHWSEWILEKQPQILRLWLRMTVRWVGQNGAKRALWLYCRQLGSMERLTVLRRPYGAAARFRS
jgi:hypothetical protein